MTIFAALLIAAILGGSTSAAAQNTLPGDALYPVKIHVNEAVREALAFSPSAKAIVEADLANDRLDEAQTLATKGKLSSAAATELIANFKKHADQADEDAGTVSKDDPATGVELGASLKARFAAHKDILEVFDASSTTLPASTNGILASLTAKLNATSTVKINPEALAHLSDGHLSALADKAKRKLSEATQIVTKLSATTTASTSPSVDAFLVAHATAMVTFATDRYAAGVAAVSASSTDKTVAYTAFVQSLQASFAAEAYAKAAMHLSDERDQKSEDQDNEDHGKNQDEHGNATSTWAKDQGDEHKSATSTDRNDHGDVHATSSVKNTDGDNRDDNGTDDATEVHVNAGINLNIGH